MTTKKRGRGRSARRLRPNLHSAHTSTTISPAAPVKDVWSGVPVGPVAAAEVRSLVAPYDGPPTIQGKQEAALLLAEAWHAVPPMYRRQPGNVLALLLQAQALNIAVATAMQNLFYEDGQVAMRGALIWALIVRAGHRIETVKRDGKTVTLELVRGDHQPGGTATWTLAEAQRVGLTSRETWRGVPGPATMLFWRCVARLGREYASDVLLGFGYLPDELHDRPTGPAEISDRTVDAGVEELLVGAELLDETGLREVWKRADRNGLSDRYAGSVNGVEYTVAGLLATMIASVGTRSTTSDAVPDGVDPDQPAPADLPAGEGTMECGCDAAQVVATGEHQPAVCAFEKAWDDE